MKKKIIAAVLIACISTIAFLGGVFFSAPDCDYDGDYDDDYAYYDDFGYDEDSYDGEYTYWNEDKAVFDPEQIINDIPESFDSVMEPKEINPEAYADVFAWQHAEEKGSEEYLQWLVAKL